MTNEVIQNILTRCVSARMTTARWREKRSIRFYSALCMHRAR